MLVTWQHVEPLADTGAVRLHTAAAARSTKQYMHTRFTTNQRSHLLAITGGAYITCWSSVAGASIDAAASK